MKPIIVFCGVLLVAGIAIAQEAPMQFYASEVAVKPSMNAAYLNFLKNVKETYQKQGVNLSYSILSQDDFTYYFFTSMESMDIGEVYKRFDDTSRRW